MRWGSARSSCGAFALALLLITVAEAAGEKSAKPSEFIFVVQIVLLIAVGRGLGEIMQRIGQPSVIGELLGGLLLGPSLFGWLWPEAQSAIFPSAPEQKAPPAPVRTRPLHRSEGNLGFLVPRTARCARFRAPLGAGRPVVRPWPERCGHRRTRPDRG